MANVILVGYQVGPSGLEGELPEIQAPKTWKDKEKIAAHKAEKEAEWLAEQSQQPYTGQLTAVSLSDLKRHDVAHWSHESTPSLANTVGDWICERYPEYRDCPPICKSPPDSLMFVGFSPKTFLRLLGISASLTGDPLPLALWSGASNYRDIGNIVKPTDYKGLSWTTVLKARGLSEDFDEWTEPGEDAVLDLSLATALAGQIGLLTPATVGA